MAGAVAGGAMVHHDRKMAAEQEQAYDQAPAGEQAAAGYEEQQLRAAAGGPG